MRKTKPLTKQRFKPQVSAAFGSLSIKIDAQSINPDQKEIFALPYAFQRKREMGRYADLFIFKPNVQNVFLVSPDIR